MSVISDREVRGDLSLKKIKILPLHLSKVTSIEQHNAANSRHRTKAGQYNFLITHLSFLLAFILALSKVRGLSLVQQLAGDGGAA